MLEAVQRLRDATPIPESSSSYGLTYHMLRGRTKRLGRKEMKEDKQLEVVVRG
jgi:hypothetical protein